MDAAALAVGGTADHIHILAGLRTKHCAADVVKEVKLASGLWIRETQGVKPFAWQDGYGAFSVSPDHVEAVIHYIATQRSIIGTSIPEPSFLSSAANTGSPPMNSLSNSPRPVPGRALVACNERVATRC